MIRIIVAILLGLVIVAAGWFYTMSGSPPSKKPTTVGKPIIIQPVVKPLDDSRRQAIDGLKLKKDKAK